MSVFSRIRQFFSRHRNKFIVGGVLVGGTILLSRYAQKRLIEWQEKQALEFLERTRKQHHFESIGRTCNQTILNLSSSLFDAVLRSESTQAIIEELKQNPPNKIELWNSLKILVFTKTGCMIYSIVILVVTLRIQLSILGGYLYKNPNSISTEMQEKYLSICQDFLNNAVTNLSAVIEKEVKSIVDVIDLKKQLKLSDLEAIFWSIQTAIATNNENPIDKLRQVILGDDIPNGDDVYSHLVRDTADFLDSDEIKSLSTHFINRGFIQLADQISEFYIQGQSNGKIKEVPSTSTAPVSNETEFHNPFDDKKPLAKLLPIINGILNRQSFPLQFVQQLTMNEKLLKLGANVYESLL